MVKDPICGMEVSESSVHRAEREGKTWYFCCDGCRVQFLKSGVPDSKKKQSSCCGHDSSSSVDSNRVTKRFYCPMCPGVESDHPGHCPKCGMDLIPKNPVDDSGLVEQEALKKRFWICLIFGIPGVLLPMIQMHGFTQLSDRWVDWIGFASSLPVIFWGGWSFWGRALNSFRNRSFNMFTLIFVGVGAAFLYSLTALLVPQWIPSSFQHHGRVPLYFESATGITVLVLLGQYLESRARNQTGEAIRALMARSPKTARLVRNDVETEVSVQEVQVGDFLRIKPGDQVPVDGVITEGGSYVDESMITGESMPIQREIQDPVKAGTLNQNGSFLMKAEKVGEETLFAQIIKMVSEAQRSRAPIQHLADKVAGIFVPLVLLIALITFCLWAWLGPPPAMAFALVNAIAVLIIACPCALGLATPMSITVGMGRGAQQGILIKDAEALEQLAGIDTLVIDKTGTLTEGKPRLVQLSAEPGFSDQQVLSWATSVERQSEHPIASMVMNAAKQRSIVWGEVENFSAFPGEGVSGMVKGEKVCVGTRDFLKRMGVGVGIDENGDKGLAHIWVSNGGRVAGSMAFADPLKSTTLEAIKSIQSMGIQVVMLTGDDRRVADQIAKTLGIQEVHASMKPAEKQKHIVRLQQAGGKVAMAGDGINDAPALSTANVGIAMGTGTDVAMESAEVTLLRGDLKGIAQAVQLSRATMRNIRQNLFFAFFYNAAGVPIAAGILYPFWGLLLSPLVASFAMSLSCVSLILNSLRLRRSG